METWKKSEKAKVKTDHTTAKATKLATNRATQTELWKTWKCQGPSSREGNSISLTDVREVNQMNRLWHVLHLPSPWPEWINPAGKKQKKERKTTPKRKHPQKTITQTSESKSSGWRNSNNTDTNEHTRSLTPLLKFLQKNVCACFDWPLSLVFVVGVVCEGMKNHLLFFWMILSFLLSFFLMVTNYIF